MKRKITFRFLLWCLVCILGAMSLVGCSSNDENTSTYMGIISSVGPETNHFVIDVVKCPLNNSATEPRKNDKLLVDLPNDTGMKLEKNTKIEFSVILAKSHYNSMETSIRVWICDIKILKVY